MEAEVKSLVFEVASMNRKRRQGVQIGTKWELARNRKNMRVEMEVLGEEQCCRKDVVDRQKEREGG